jgi:hypothetical protein
MFNELTCLSTIKKSYLLTKSFLKIFIFFLLGSFVVNAQLRQQNINPKFNLRSINTMKENVNGLNENVLSKIKIDSTPCFYKRKGEWQNIIDDYWGSGTPTATKLQIFDTYWNAIDKEYGGFPYLEVNWDSIKTLYRPEVEAGVSNGCFYAIMCQLYFSLHEIHTFIEDGNLYSPFMQGDDYVYNPGVPAFWISGWTMVGNFGAALTPLPDSSLLVYRAISPHPLGIVPGDIILGYENIPWKNLYKELLSAQIPMVWLYFAAGSAPGSTTHALLNSAGNNWGLFDTVDVVKYATGDTVHLPTTPLNGLDWYSLFATDQVPVAGVKMPDYNQGELVTWGIVQNTTVGYVYVYAWESPVRASFEAAIKDLVTVKKVTGIIVDFRFNLGGDIPSNANPGFDYLFNEFPDISRWVSAYRTDPANHLSFSISTPTGTSFSPRPDYFDRPIAVLTGPASVSNGECNSFRMRLQPMVRFFGLPTSGAYVGEVEPARINSAWGTWYYWYARGQMKSFINNEGFLMHKCFPVDEEVWLTPEGVAKGEDDVVKRALEWMNNLVYSHSIATDKKCYTLGGDSIHVFAAVENPNSHQLSARAYFHAVDGVLVDSVDLSKQTIIGTSENWTTNVIPPSMEEFFKVSVTAFDESASTSLTLPNAVRFTTAGPVTLDSVSYRKGLLNFHYVRPFVHNWGNVKSIGNASLKFISSDPWIKSIGQPALLPTIPAGTTIGGASWCALEVFDSLFPGYFNFKIEISVDGWTYWVDSMKVITGVGEEENEIPTEYSLSQNFPNPFNPNTKIIYTIPLLGGDESLSASGGGGLVTLKVFDILGREVATLVNEYIPAGKYETEFNAAAIPSGVYFYQLLVSALQSKDGKARNFIQTKKMLLLK